MPEPATACIAEEDRDAYFIKKTEMVKD